MTGLAPVTARERRHRRVWLVVAVILHAAALIGGGLVMYFSRR